MSPVRVGDGPEGKAMRKGRKPRHAGQDTHHLGSDLLTKIELRKNRSFESKIVIAIQKKKKKKNVKIQK